jgi:hypothetical protein
MAWRYRLPDAVMFCVCVNPDDRKGTSLFDALLPVSVVSPVAYVHAHVFLQPAPVFGVQ